MSYAQFEHGTYTKLIYGKGQNVFFALRADFNVEVNIFVARYLILHRGNEIRWLGKLYHFYSPCAYNMYTYVYIIICIHYNMYTL